METCPNCKSKLNIDEKSSGRCFSCGTAFEPSLSKERSQFSYSTSDNTIAKLIKICGFVIIVLGTILSLVTAGGDGYKYEFSLSRFMIPELVSVSIGLFFIGFSEVIQLLEDIRNKLTSN
ncbi:MAG: hypothetical protein HDQ95_03275 [Roseburia sp.]|nr:hypothetical protein [Roseburia sp.]